jgi:hypothetical protein
VAPRLPNQAASGGVLIDAPGRRGARSGVRRTAQETVQPDREALLYWATGLGAAFLEGALERELKAPEDRLPVEAQVSNGIPADGDHDGAGPHARQIETLAAGGSPWALTRPCADAIVF